MLQPAALHLSFKVTWACTSRHTPDLLLGPHTDNSGQGTCTPSVSRLYRRAVGISDVEVIALTLLPSLAMLIAREVQVCGFHIHV